MDYMQKELQSHQDLLEVMEEQSMPRQSRHNQNLGVKFGVSTPPKHNGAATGKGTGAHKQTPSVEIDLSL